MSHGGSVYRELTPKGEGSKVEVTVCAIGHQEPSTETEVYVSDLRRTRIPYLKESRLFFHLQLHLKDYKLIMALKIQVGKCLPCQVPAGRPVPSRSSQLSPKHLIL